MNSILKLLRFLIGFFLIVAIGIIIGGVSLYLYFSHDLPKLDSLRDYNPPVVSEVYSDDGTVIGEFWNEKRYVLTPKELPKSIVQAIVAGEDDRFFEHKGIDIWGIFRAFLENLKAGHVVQGGSTITQQVTKSLLLTSERSIERKVKEAILATRIEQTFNKEEILYLYLNQTFFGNRSYGIEAAARNYFHKSAKELNIAEAAMIAGLAKAPTTFSPLTNPVRAKQRQEYIIQRMYEVGYITEDQVSTSKKMPIYVFKAGTDKEYNYKYAPWMTEYIRRYIQQKYGNEAPYTMGLKVYSTTNMNMQRAADKAVLRGVEELDKREGYLGPIRHIDQNQYDSFNKSNHLKILDAATDKILVGSKPTEEQLMAIATPLSDTGRYEAVITDVDSKNQLLAIQVGNIKGIIKMPDYTWARKRNQNSAGYDGASYIKDPSGTFNKGDIILVKTKTPTADEVKSKGYLASNTYFALSQRPPAEGALFSYDPFSGEVKAMVGGKDFKESEFNRAIQALRQTGSSIKPLIFSAALDKGYTPASVIEDSPIYYEYTPGHFWSPQNYGGGFKGPTTFRSALVNSRNVVTVKILMDVGLDYFTSYVRKLGITTPIKKVYAMALGANDMKLYELCRAYGAFVTGGILPEYVFIKQITDRFGRVLEQAQPRQIKPFKEQLADLTKQKNADKIRDDLYKTSEKWVTEDKLKINDIEKKILYGSYIPDGYVISPKTAYTMVQLMNDVVNFGTGYKVKELKRPAAGKTGTTNDETDTWFVGFTPELFAGVWVGFDQVQKIGGNETGGHTAAPIFLYYMQEALKDKPVAQFNIPKEINTEALQAPVDTSSEDAEAGGIIAPDGSNSGGADFFIHDF